VVALPFPNPGNTFLARFAPGGRPHNPPTANCFTFFLTVKQIIRYNSRYGRAKG
jgi:hypothetical protein